jgi:hypothetical protein
VRQQYVHRFVRRIVLGLFPGADEWIRDVRRYLVRDRVQQRL